MEDNKVRGTIFRGTVIIAAVAVLAKFASFISQAILAAYLGTTKFSDAYYMVTGVQQVIYPMLSVGVWKVFLPIYKEKIAKNDNSSANALANQFSTLLTLVSVVIVVVIMIGSNVVVGIVAPGFEGETKELCSRLLRISAPMYVLIISAAIYSVMLQCHNKFFGSQIREVASHIPTILTALIFYKRWGINALAAALVVGGLVRLLIQLPFVDWGYKFRPDFRFRNSELRLMLKRLPSALVSEGVNQLNILIDKTMASGLPAGAVSALNYSGKLAGVFYGLISTAIGTALYPQIAECAALNKREELSRIVEKVIRMFLMLMVPVSMACFLFAGPLVSVVFERGSFTSESAALTTGVFACYSVGMCFMGGSILMNIYYGFGDTKTPMYISIVNMAANVTGNIIFISLLGVKGLSLSTSTSALAAVILNLILIRKYIKLNYRSLLVNVVKVVFAGVIACGAAWWLCCKKLTLNIYLELILAALIGVVLYVALMKMLRVREVDDLAELFKTVIARKRKKHAGK